MSENGPPSGSQGLPKSISRSIEIIPESTLVCNALFQGVQVCAPRPKMIQNGPKTDANVCVDYAIQADTQICRARSARYVLEQSLVLAHTEFRYVMLLHTLPRSDYVHSMTFAASSLGLFGLTFLLKIVIGQKSQTYIACKASLHVSRSPLVSPGSLDILDRAEARWRSRRVRP